MITITKSQVFDYHNWKHDDAIEHVHLVVGRIRQLGIAMTVEFIVGHGTIRKDLISVLEQYGLEPTVKLNNRGVIIVTVE